jgi:lipid-A-disaccharide synthase
MLVAYERVRHDRASVDGRVLLASSLDEATRQRALRVASEAHVPVFEVEPMEGAMGVLRAFDAALCASGTVSMEAALARAVPVIAYRVGLTTELVARLLVKVPFVGLPNILLERGAFTELLQRNATADLMAEALDHALTHHDELLASCDELEARLGPRRSPSREVARLLSPWLRLRPRE